MLASVAQEVVTRYDARVVFLPMQYPEDVRAAESIAERIEGAAKAQVTVLPGEYRTHELLSLVGNMDLMIAIRLHALIFAGVMGVPMIGISYDPKIDRFLSSIGEQPVGNLRDVTADELMAEIRRKWNDKQTFRRNNADLLVRLRDLAARNAGLALNLAHRY